MELGLAGKVVVVTGASGGIGRGLVLEFAREGANVAALDIDSGAALQAEARRRLAQLIPDEQKAASCDYVLTNDGAITELEWQVDQLWPILRSAAR